MTTFGTRRLYILLCVLIVLAGLSTAAWLPNQRSPLPIRVSTTNAGLAITNLNSQIASLQKLFSEQPNRFEFRRRLFELLLTRTQFLGSYSDFAQLNKLTALAPTSLDEYLLRARYLTVTHQFNDALEMLAAAQRLAPDNKEIKRKSIPIRLARRQNLAELRTEQLAELKQNRSYGNLVLIAGIEAELGNFEDADSYFEEAIRSYRDTSPFPIAFLYFQRGVMWSEKAGNTTRGHLYYQEAIHYLPQFVAAQVHLVEIAQSSGDTASAIAGLESVASAEDPEPRALLGELLRNAGREQEAASYIDTATSAYNELLEKYPLAFADHGAEFFSGPGADPARGLELAKVNLTNRKSERAYIVAIEAAHAAGAESNLSDFVSEARLLGPVFVPLIEIIRTASQK